MIVAGALPRTAALVVVLELMMPHARIALTVAFTPPLPSEIVELPVV
jgi:hypothetical protein